MRLYKIGLAIALLICLLDMPYGYYQLLRLVGMISFLFFAYEHREDQEKIWLFFWLGSAILINPIFKIALGRALWNFVDVIWAIILIYQSKSTK